MAKSVHIKNLLKTFGHVRAVDDVTLWIKPGELFFLLGPSGCGKTTLLRCVAGFYDPDEGEIHIGDRNVTRLPPHQRDTGMVFQSYALWPHMTVSENVAFGLEMRKTKKHETQQRVAEALAMVQMSDRASHKPNQLSGGQQQRVALARALVVHPQCILLDEPLSNLDAKLRMEMRQEIRRICKDVGRTAIYVTHDQKEALSIADRMAVIHEGRIQQVGTPEEIYRRPQSRFVANFIGETNFLEGSVKSVYKSGAKIETQVGDLLADSGTTHGMMAGDKVVVSLRPEVLNLGAAPEGATNVLRSKIEQTIYLGEIAQHQIRLMGADGTVPTLKVFELNPRSDAGSNEHERSLWVNPSDVVVLKE